MAQLRTSAERLPRQERAGGWRSTSDLGFRYELQPNHATYRPKNTADALETIRAEAIQAITDYDGQACQAGMVEDEAKRRWPELFNLEEAAVPHLVPNPVVVGKRAVEAYFANHSRSNGSVDWTAVAQDTTYVVSRTTVEPATLTVPAAWSVLPALAPVHPLTQPV